MKTSQSSTEWKGGIQAPLAKDITAEYLWEWWGFLLVLEVLPDVVLVLKKHSKPNQSKLNQTKELLEISLLALIRFFNLRV